MGAFVAGAWVVACLCLWVAMGWRLEGLGPWRPEGLAGEFPGGALRAAASAGLVLAAGLGWGGWTCKALGVLPRWRGFARPAVSLAAGLVIESLLVFAVGAAQLLPWGLLVVPVGLGGIPSALRAPGCRECPPARAWARVWMGLAALALGLAFVVSLAPATESDGLRYHLFGPQEFLKAGGIVHLFGHAFTNLPFQTNMLFMAAMSVGGPRAAQPVHWVFLPLAMFFAGCIARSLVRSIAARQRDAAIATGEWEFAAGVVAGTSPVALVLAGWPFVDLSTLAYLLGGVWAMTPGSIPRADRRALLAGLFFGAAVGTKLTAVIPGVVAFGVLGVQALRSGQLLRRLTYFAVPAALVPMPWFVKSAILHGNPVYPAAYGVFGGAEWDADTDAFYKSKAAEKGFGKSPADLALSPLDVTIRWRTTRPDPNDTSGRLLTRTSPGFEDQNPGPAPLALLPLALLAFGWTAVRRSSAGLHLAAQLAVGWLAWFLTYQSVRFLLFPMALIAIGGTAGIAAVFRAKWRHAGHALLLALALSGAGWYATYTVFGAWTRPFASALGLIPEEDLLSAAIDSHDAVRWLNDEVQPGEAVAFIGEHRGLYARFPVRTSDWFDRPFVLEAIRATADNDTLLSQWRAESIRYVLVNYAQLGLYEGLYFRPRFSDAEWARYRDLIDRLYRGVVFRPRDGVVVVDLTQIPGAKPDL